VLRRYLENKNEYSQPITWAEFYWDGQFLRGGQSDISEFATRFYVHPNENEELSALTKVAQRAHIQPGHIEQLNDGTFLWFVPFTPSESETFSETRLKGFHIQEHVFNNIIATFNSSSKLTKAEKRIAYQPTAGKSLAQAAQEDEVSVETKRAQLKLLCSKLSCKGQKGLVRLTLGQIVHIVTMTDSESADTGIVEKFAQHYFGADVRLTIQRLPNGRLQRVFECGPIDGKPVVMFHGMLYPLVFWTAKAHLENNNVRLIMPIRHGFLEARPVSELYRKSDLLDKTMEDVALYIQHFCASPITILGQSLGSVLAIRFTNLYPDLVSKLLLLSVNQAQESGSNTEYNQRFYNGLKSVLNKPGVFRFISWQFRKYYTDNKAVRNILRKMFETCADDVAALDSKVGKHEPYAWFKDSYKHSVVGIAEDFSFAMDSSNYEFSSIDVPITFIQGENDPMTSIE